MEQGKTKIQVGRNVRDLLRGLKRGAETYDDVVRALIEDSAKLDGGRASTVIGTTGESASGVLAKGLDNSSLDTQTGAGTPVSDGEQNGGSSSD